MVVIGLASIIPLYLTVDIFRFMFFGKRIFGSNGWIYDLVILTLFYFLFANIFGLFQELDCCNDLGAIYSPDHRLTLNFWIISAFGSVIYSNFRDSLLPPLAEILLNGVLVMAIILNIITWMHLGLIGAIGHLTAILIFSITFFKNYNLIHKEIKGEVAFRKLFWSDYSLKEIPFALCSFLALLPLNIFSTLLLLLFGQKPDSLIRVFTETYHYNLSELTYLCENVHCGGHYLCSVAANGHAQIVKPIRLGVRKSGLIVCNRQLLVSNAFEELLETRFPIAHRFIRKKYDLVGELVHKHYNLFKIKWVSNLTYVLMKPLEWFFIIVLYLFDRRPEDRIALQYFPNKEKLRKLLNE